MSAKPRNLKKKHKKTKKNGKDKKKIIPTNV